MDPIDAVAVEMVDTEALTAAQRREIILVCVEAHDSTEFERLFSFIPSGGRHFLAFDGSTLVSHAVVTVRWARPEGLEPLKTAFVDAVSTLPSFQGRGFASAAMRKLAASIEDFEIGCLQTDRVSFYERLGWELWRGPLAGRSGEALIPTPWQRGVMVLRLPRTPSIDLDRQLSIERQPTRIWE
jgi:aminoglycoside 2'-N-acetyltransferase I